MRRGVASPSIVQSALLLRGQNPIVIGLASVSVPEGATSVAVANALPMSKPLKLPPVTVTATSCWFPSQTTTCWPVPTVVDCVSGGSCSTVTSTTPKTGSPSQVTCRATETTTSVTYCACSMMLTSVVPPALADPAPTVTSRKPAAVAESQRACFICPPSPGRC